MTGGKKYRQLVESRWDKEKKQSRLHVIKHLGPVKEDEHGREHLVLSSQKFDTVDRSTPVGELALFWKMAEELKVLESVYRSVGEDKKDVSMAILVLALNQLLGRRPLTKLGAWVGETPIPRWANVDPGKMTRDYFLSALDRISMDGGKTSYSRRVQNSLVESWRRVVGDDPARFFFYQDITRIRWNGGNTFWAENGYGHEKGRPHIGFGLIVSKDNLMPAMGYPVRGGDTDKTTVEETMAGLAGWNPGDVTLVWDRGFVSKQNVDMARTRGFHVLSAGPRTSSQVVEWLSKYDDYEIEKREQIIALSKGKGVYYKETIGELYGYPCKIVVLLDPDRRNHMRIERDMLIQALEEEASKKKIAMLKQMLKPIVVSSKGRRGYKIDQKEEELARRLDGRTLLFSTDTNMSGKDIVHTYFQKDRIEKAFRHLKGDACLAPVRYQQPGRVEAYLSVVNFIAYMLIAATLGKIREHKLNTSYEDLMEEASRIHEVEFTLKNKKLYRWTHISKDLEKTLEPFKIQTLKT